MTVYYHWVTRTGYINAYPDEKTEDGKYMIISGDRRNYSSDPLVGKWLVRASDQSYVKLTAKRITEQEAKALIRENKLCKIADKITSVTF